MAPYLGNADDTPQLIDNCRPHEDLLTNQRVILVVGVVRVAELQKRRSGVNAELLVKKMKESLQEIAIVCMECFDCARRARRAFLALSEDDGGHQFSHFGT